MCALYVWVKIFKNRFVTFRTIRYPKDYNDDMVHFGSGDHKKGLKKYFLVFEASFFLSHRTLLYFKMNLFTTLHSVYANPKVFIFTTVKHSMDRVKRIWYLSHMRAAKVQASLRIRAVSPEPSLLAHTSSESKGTFRQKTRSLAPLNGWACAVEICHDGMLEDTNSLDGARIILHRCVNRICGAILYFRY